MVSSFQCHMWRIGTCRGITQDCAIPYTHFHELKGRDTLKKVGGLRVWWRPQDRKGQIFRALCRKARANLRQTWSCIWRCPTCWLYATSSFLTFFPWWCPIGRAHSCTCLDGDTDMGGHDSVPFSYSSWRIVPERTQSPSTYTYFSPKGKWGTSRKGEWIFQNKNILKKELPIIR